MQGACSTLFSSLCSVQQSASNCDPCNSTGEREKKNSSHSRTRMQARREGEGAVCVATNERIERAREGGRKKKQPMRLVLHTPLLGLLHVRVCARVYQLCQARSFSCQRSLPLSCGFSLFLNLLSFVVEFAFASASAYYSWLVIVDRQVQVDAFRVDCLILFCFMSCLNELEKKQSVRQRNRNGRSFLVQYASSSNDTRASKGAPSHPAQECP